MGLQCTSAYLCTLLHILSIFTYHATAMDCESLLTKELKTEIQGYQEVANKIIEAAQSGEFKGRTYQNLALFADKFGQRFTGTEALEKSIDWAARRMETDKFDNVKTEEVKINRWVRGEEKATLVSPRKKDLQIIGLGLGVATPAGGITAPALVVKTFAELDARKAEAEGKIVVFNQDWSADYYITVSYRTRGVIEAAKVGALAVLVRSVTPFSINSPHTGYVRYSNDTKHLPVAAITQEDAELLYRLEQGGEKIEISLQIDAHYEEPSVSRNVYGDLTGSSMPNHFVLTGCHVDSWDVGEGVLDDAAGCFVSMETINLLNSLKLKPKRTLRNIWFTAEEVGMVGSTAYVKSHMHELENIQAVMESDFGTFTPKGMKYAGTETGACIVKEVLNLLKPINATQLIIKADTGGDTSPFVEEGITGMMMYTDDTKYMWFHHTEGDTMTVYSPEELDSCLAMWTVATYVIADLKTNLPIRLSQK